MKTAFFHLYNIKNLEKITEEEKIKVTLGSGKRPDLIMKYPIKYLQSLKEELEKKGYSIVYMLNDKQVRDLSNPHSDYYRWLLYYFE